MRKVKTLTQRNPIFLQTAYKYDHLIDLQNDDRFIESGELDRHIKGAREIYRKRKEVLNRELIKAFKVVPS